MECNNAKALKAIQIVELKVAEFDFAGAKKYALKAQRLYPELDGLLQFLTTVNVYISAEKGTNGEVDWCKVLSVEPSADKDTIKKKFRKLALVLHPDKNKSAGAEGAFKIISDAKEILCKKKQLSMDVRAEDVSSSMPTTHNETQDSFKTRYEGSATPTMPTSHHETRDFFYTRDKRSATPRMPAHYIFWDFFGTRDEGSATPTMPTHHGFRDFFDTRDEGSATPTMPFVTSSMPTTRNAFFGRNLNTSDARIATFTMPCATHTNPYAPPTIPESSMPITQNDLPDFLRRKLNTMAERSSTPTMPCATPTSPFAAHTMPDRGSSMPTSQNQFQNSFRSKNSNTRDGRSAASTKPCVTRSKPCATPTRILSTSHPQKGRKITFWTICSCCSIYFEYLRRFRNHKLQCRFCCEHFIAKKVPAPKNASKSTPFDQEKHSQNTMPSNSCHPGRTDAAATDVGSSGISGVGKGMFAPGNTHIDATDVRSSGL